MAERGAAHEAAAPPPSGADADELAAAHEETQRRLASIHICWVKYLLALLEAPSSADENRSAVALLLNWG
jgi:hypothetical protein